MKPTIPHDPLDDLIAAALHGELTSQERAQFESQLANDPAAQAVYQEALAMHDLLEKTNRSAQPDTDFEQRMVSGVRRKLQTDTHRETAWESLLALWQAVRAVPSRLSLPRLAFQFIAVLGICAILAGVALGPITSGIKGGSQVKSVFTTISSQLAMAEAQATPAPMTIPGQPANNDLASPSPVALPPKPLTMADRLARIDKNESRLRQVLQSNPNNQAVSKQLDHLEQLKQRYELADNNAKDSDSSRVTRGRVDSYSALGSAGGMTVSSGQLVVNASSAASPPPDFQIQGIKAKSPSALQDSEQAKPTANYTEVTTTPQGGTVRGSGFQAPDTSKPAAVPAPDDRKLIRNAQLDLEVKSFQAAMDQITALTKNAGGYVDTSNAQKGGNGKLQGAVVVKILPQNLDDFLLKLRDLGEVKNQSVSTDDVTKDYFDTQARLVNSQKMETQLQDLLKRENGKVADLLAVERELGRVRGDIEQMQGQLKLYDFQVQYATITIQLAEKDLKQTAAYLLKEQDNFSLFATDVEGTFQKARQTADDFKAQVLAANLNHNSGSDVSADLDVMVAPDQIEPFLAQIRLLGRVANFTRQTQRIAQDGGDSTQPADETLTEKDKVRVQLAIRSDDETRKQVALTVVAKAVDDALDQAKAAALTNAGVEILSSSLNKTPQGQSTAELSVRVPGKEYAALMDSFRALGRTSSLSIQRNDNSGPGANGDDAPVIVSLSLTDDDAPVQQTDMAIVADDVDMQAQQIKKDAGDAGVEVKASSFSRDPDGTESAQMTLRLPMGKYAAFIETLKKIGKVESLSVRRDDRPDQTQTDDTAPAEISLQLHNERAIVADNDGLWPTLRNTFGDGMSALFGSVRVIGVLLAFLAPWVFTLILFAWIGRRIYVWRKKR